jgi:putative tricarboxylic transport membrane protein
LRHRCPAPRWRSGPAEYFSLVVLGLIASVALASGSMVKALAMIVLGLLLGTVGQDIYSGTPRFTFGSRELYDGLNFVSLAVGLFGVAEILRNLEARGIARGSVRKVQGLWLTRSELRQIVRPVLRGTGLGSMLGVLPGGGHVLAPTPWRSGCPDDRRRSVEARSKGWPGRSRPTMPPRRRPSSPC